MEPIEADNHLSLSGVQTIETATFRYKALIGRGLCARTLPDQKTEAKVGCAVLNRMTLLGMPMSQRVA